MHKKIKKHKISKYLLTPPLLNSGMPGKSIQNRIDLMAGPVQVRYKTGISKNSINLPGLPVTRATQQNQVEIFFFFFKYPKSCSFHNFILPLSFFSQFSSSWRAMAASVNNEYNMALYPVLMISSFGLCLVLIYAELHLKHYQISQFYRR